MPNYELDVAGRSDDVADLRALLIKQLEPNAISLKMRPATRRDFSIMQVLITAAASGVVATTFDVLKTVLLSKLKTRSKESSPIFSIRIDGDRIDIAAEADIDKLQKRFKIDS